MKSVDWIYVGVMVIGILNELLLVNNKFFDRINSYFILVNDKFFDSYFIVNILFLLISICLIC